MLFNFFITFSFWSDVWEILLLLGFSTDVTHQVSLLDIVARIPFFYDVFVPFLYPPTYKPFVLRLGSWFPPICPDDGSSLLLVLGSPLVLYHLIPCMDAKRTSMTTTERCKLAFSCECDL